MRIPETPNSTKQLDLMRRLEAYAEGKATWYTDGGPLGDKVKSECRTLHTNTLNLVDKVLAPILDRTTARELETFTMHDHTHGLKVAHLMWHILKPSRRGRLTPPEIGLLVIAAHLHDLGMALTKEDRTARLEAGSNLWDRLEVEEHTKAKMEHLRQQAADLSMSERVRRRAKLALDQAEEALLCQDTRERHATPKRYTEMLDSLCEFHEKDPVNIPSIEGCLSFDGDSLRGKLVDICVSHNEDSVALVRRDAQNPEQARFPTGFPVGCCAADLHMVSAALRLADILDFDRERTPAVLFYYLIPGPLSAEDNRSVLEWGKHLAISNWNVESEAIVFRGRCRDHLIHHAVVQFCASIQEEIAATRATFGAMQEETSWPFQLPASVKAEIFEEGYHYVPYRFELDDQRIYELLMGGAIYDNPLVALRELVQNSVDACKLRDAFTQLNEPYLPKTTDRIFVRYEEPNDKHPQPTITVTDTGTGMDAFILERYFLKVGQSYYRSSEFNRERVLLQKKNLDFAPVSEFGIGFLACFLLAERVEVETAMGRGDRRKRTLLIDGPTRLIRMSEEQNEGSQPFTGTSVTLHIVRGPKGGAQRRPPSSEEIEAYLRNVCQDLPYRLAFEHVTGGAATQSWIDSKPLKVELPSHLESCAIRIPVADEKFGLEGEIALINPYRAKNAEADLFKDAPVSLATEAEALHHFGPAQFEPHSALLRGGFKIGAVPGLPQSFVAKEVGRARLRLTWATSQTRRYPLPNLARNAASDEGQLAQEITSIWLTHLLDHVDELPEGQVYFLQCVNLEGCPRLEKYDALTIYRLAARGWHFLLREKGYKQDEITAWEAGVGNPLWLGVFRDDLYWKLLDLILPKIATLQMGRECRFYVKPPVGGWREILKSWRQYMSAPVKWGLFAEYTGTIENLLSYNYPGSTQLNSHFKDRLTGFREDELVSLKGALDELTHAASREQPGEFMPSEVLLLRRAQEVAGNIKIGSTGGSWRLDSFKI